MSEPEDFVDKSITASSLGQLHSELRLCSMHRFVSLSLPPFSPDLILCDLFLVPQVNLAVIKTKFETLKASETFHTCFQKTTCGIALENWEFTCNGVGIIEASISAIMELLINFTNTNFHNTSLFIFQQHIVHHFIFMSSFVIRDFNCNV